MKKFLSLFLGCFLFFVMVGCGTITTVSTTAEVTTAAPTTEAPTTVNWTTSTIHTTLAQLDTPTNIEVLNNVITFDAVGNATKYRIIVYSTTDQLIGEYNITNGFDLSLLISVGSYKLQMKATANGYLD